MLPGGVKCCPVVWLLCFRGHWLLLLTCILATGSELNFFFPLVNPKQALVSLLLRRGVVLQAVAPGNSSADLVLGGSWCTWRGWKAKWKRCCSWTRQREHEEQRRGNSFVVWCFAPVPSLPGNMSLHSYHYADPYYCSACLSMQPCLIVIWGKAFHDLGWIEASCVRCSGLPGWQRSSSLLVKKVSFPLVRCVPLNPCIPTVNRLCWPQLPPQQLLLTDWCANA